MSNYTYRLGFGLAFSRKADVRLFERMAKKGYRPVSLNIFGLYKFERCEKEEVSFAFDCTKVTQRSEDFESYCDIFKQSGWTFVYGKGGCNFFKAPQGTTPLYTDGQSESLMWREMAKKMLPYTIATLVIFVAYLCLYLIFGNTPGRDTFWVFAGILAVGNAVMIFGVVRCYYFASNTPH